MTDQRTDRTYVYLDGPHRRPGRLERILRWLGYWIGGQ